VSPASAPVLPLDRDVLEQWADFDAPHRHRRSPADVQRAFDFTLRPRVNARANNAGVTRTGTAMLA
jgi:hypothetical protein